MVGINRYSGNRIEEEDDAQPCDSWGRDGWDGHGQSPPQAPLSEEWALTVVDRDDEHYYQPGFLFIPFGFLEKKNIVKPKSKFILKGVEFIVAEIDRIVPEANEVILKDGRKLPYDRLDRRHGGGNRPGRDARDAR
ncbi:MAG: hypothetical protein MZV63_06250 [Marinilabiliales bacterium]|nr:hypothetical protein [Marinilabiliales bacterium]